jgi:hypothetical protein
MLAKVRPTHIQGSRRMETTMMNNEKRNVILNKKGSSLPSFYIPAADDVPEEYDPRSRRAFKPSYDNPPWPSKVRPCAS